MNRPNSLALARAFLLATGLAGCGGTVEKAEYPATWPSRVTHSAEKDCQDISGTYRASNGEQLLPFFLFGISDTTSPDWANLVQINEQLLAGPEGVTVTIRAPDSDHLEVAVAMGGTHLAKQVLTRSHRSPVAAEVWFGQHEKSFRCEPDGIVLVGAYIHDWPEYRLPDAEKKRRYRRPGKNDVGTARGYFDFSKSTDGSLTMRQRLFFCLGCGGLDELWRRWETAPGAAAK